MNYTRVPHGFLQGSALRRSLLTACTTALLGVAAIGCGDDEPKQTPVAGMSGGGGGGAGGAGGMSGGPSNVAGAPAPVACGSAMCTPRPNPLTQLLGSLGMGAPIPALPTPVACCFDEANGVCGVAAMAGATCEVYATPDARCPSIGLGALGAAAGGLGNFGAGCCAPSGQCGLDGAIFGRGCVENAQANSMLSAIPLITTLLSVPPAQLCDRPLDDAGVDDAGI